MMIIRPETENNFGEIYELVKIAFQTAKVSNGKEQDFVNQLRAGGNYIPELALVAEEDGKLIGHIMLTKIFATRDDGKFEALLLAPISVEIEHRNKGIGSELISKSFNLARQLGYAAVFLVGDPAYYHRFGFRPGSAFGIKTASKIPDENFMACELIPNALKGIAGVIDSI